MHRLEEPGTHPYIEHLIDVMDAGEPSTRDEDSQFVRQESPWKDHTHELKRIRVLCDRFVSHISFKNQQSELHLAAGNGHLALVTELLNQGVGVDTRDSLGHTALHYAANRGHVHVMHLLLDRGAKIDAIPAVNYLTPLACLVWRRQSSAAKVLLARGALVRAPSALKGAVLYAAASVGDVDIAEAILRLGVDVNEADDVGKTALHRAAGGGFRRMVRLLLHHGADVNARSWIGGETPLSLSFKGGHKEIIELLRVSGAGPLDEGLSGYNLPDDRADGCR